MTLQECYAALGGNHAEVLGRLRSPRLVEKFVLRFLEDGSHGLLRRSLAEGDREEAFRAAHTIKGMCQNLAFTALADSSAALTETLRREGITPLALREAERVEEDYSHTVNAIRAFQAGR